LLHLLSSTFIYYQGFVSPQTHHSCLHSRTWVVDQSVSATRMAMVGKWQLTGAMMPVVAQSVSATRMAMVGKWQLTGAFVNAAVWQYRSAQMQ